MTDSQGNALHPRFVADLRHALNHLYDPNELRRNPLFTALDALSRGSPSLLREALMRLIGELKPRPGLSPDADAWRIYRTLHHRFVEQFTQAETATTLGVSIRQLRRQEGQALRVLADLLWTRYDLATYYAGLPEHAAEREPQGETTTNGAPMALLAGELAWLGQSRSAEETTVADLSAGALHTAEPLLRELAVHASVCLPDELPSVIVQVGPTQQALLLVLLEAIRLAAGGQIVLEAAVEATDVTLTVRSLPVNPAPAPAQLDKLTIARQIAELSGSRLETQADACDRPFIARFHLRPAAQPAILFIEDNPDTLQLYRRYLTGAGYRFIGAATDAQLARALAAATPQAIVLDVMLSGMDGWEVLGRLRAHPRTQEVPVIICSILPLEQLALSLGAAAFLQKPVSREALLATLSRVLI